MNIFENYKQKILSIINDACSKGIILLPENLSGINVDSTPKSVDFDISTNVAMILAKPNSKSPLDISKNIIELIKNSDPEIDLIEFAKPGFINIKFTNKFWSEFSKNVIENEEKYGSSQSKGKKILVEYVSANPTGPLHVGHCRGAILGDVISKLLTFNNNSVSKEYYVNDHGNQIFHFTYSVFLRIREKMFQEKFPIDNKDLYPGDYLKDIAENIIIKKKDLDFSEYEKIKDKLKIIVVEESLGLIKKNLQDLGINHDNFISETQIVNDQEVEKVIKKLKDNNFIYTGKIKAPLKENINEWVERDQLLFRSTDFGDDKDRALQKKIRRERRSY